jgi:hypothetical protein
MAVAQPLQCGSAGAVSTGMRRRQHQSREKAMHLLDRTMGRTNMETYEHEDEFNEFQAEGETEAEGGTEAELVNEELVNEELVNEELVNEDEIDELASELMSVTSEAELEQFMGGIVNTVGKKLGQFVQSPVGQQLGRALKDTARQALPAIGEAIGARYGGPLGAAVGGALGSGVGTALGLELEGLSHEDRDFEIAKQFVRLAADAAQHATQAHAGASPADAARDALAAAAQHYAPGLLAPASPVGPVASGTWVRRGSTIIIHGA